MAGFMGDSSFAYVYVDQLQYKITITSLLNEGQQHVFLLTGFIRRANVQRIVARCDLRNQKCPFVNEKFSAVDEKFKKNFIRRTYTPTKCKRIMLAVSEHIGTCGCTLERVEGAGETGTQPGIRSALLKTA